MARISLPRRMPAELDFRTIFGAFLAAIMPINLFIATQITVKLAVAPAYGSDGNHRRRAGDEVERTDRMDHGKDQWTLRVDHEKTTSAPPPEHTLKWTARRSETSRRREVQSASHCVALGSL